LGSPFYALKDEWNALALTVTNGEQIICCGRGAGRWPTTEAVIADALSLWRSYSST
jgi:homoserine dehydrogenase